MNATFLFPSSPLSPHPVHLEWAKTVCQYFFETPVRLGLQHIFSLFSKSKIIEIPPSDFLLIESLYCLPFSKTYKEMINPNCKVISIIADTSFWRKKLTLLRRVYYKFYLEHVDGFISVSERIKKDIQKYINKPVKVVRPFLVHEYRKKKLKFNRKILFIGNETKEKGFLKLIEAMKFLPSDFELFLVGNCYKLINKKTTANIHVEGFVHDLSQYFEKCSFYVHPADFDPCPVTVFEAMYAGLIPIITKDVGQSEVLEKMNLEELILESNEPELIARKIWEIESKSSMWKKNIVWKCRKIAEKFRKEKSIKRFKNAFTYLIKAIKT